jgi:DNA-binding CsgD family transcriptional regulator
MTKRTRTTGTSLPPGHGLQRCTNEADARYRRVDIPDGNNFEIIAGRHQMPAMSEECSTYRAALAERVVALGEQICTERQWTILRLWLTGRYTQKQIGEACGINQTTVFKTLNGNDIKRRGGVVKAGGIINKLRAAAAADPECQQLLAAIAECD